MNTYTIIFHVLEHVRRLKLNYILLNIHRQMDFWLRNGVALWSPLMLHLKRKVKYTTSLQSVNITSSKVFEAPKWLTESGTLYKDILNPSRPDVFTECKQSCSSKHWSNLPELSTVADSPPPKKNLSFSELRDFPYHVPSSPLPSRLLPWSNLCPTKDHLFFPSFHNYHFSHPVDQLFSISLLMVSRQKLQCLPPLHHICLETTRNTLHPFPL